VLGQCTALAHLNLRKNKIGSAGAESLAGVLAQCASLAHLILGNGSGLTRYYNAEPDALNSAAVAGAGRRVSAEDRAATEE